MLALEINDLKKTYENGVEALKGVSFTVQQGDFFALLGPNGAGKSTIIGVLTSLVNKTSGSVAILGHDIDSKFSAAKDCIGLVPQEFNFNIFDKVEHVLINQAGYYGITSKIAKIRTEKYLRQLDLWDKRKEVCRALSGGMKRRLMIARALVHEPKILVLDEPTAGVDIEIRRSMWRFIKELNHQGITIILTTHYLEEAESLCRNVAIIDHGKIIAHTTMSKILQQLDSERFILYLEQPYEVIPAIAGYQVFPIDLQTIEVEVQKTQGISGLYQELNKAGIRVVSMRNKTNRLEELFIKLTQRG